MNKNVLVVDDDAASRVLIARILRSQGFRVEFADDGAQALAILEQDPGYGVIILDLIMKGMDGFEFIERAGARDASMLRSTIVVTAGGKSAVKRAELMGVYCVVEKPFVISDLVSRIVECIRENEATLESRPT